MPSPQYMHVLPSPCRCIRRHAVPAFVSLCGEQPSGLGGEAVASPTVHARLAQPLQMCQKACSASARKTAVLLLLLLLACVVNSRLGCEVVEAIPIVHAHLAQPLQMHRTARNGQHPKDRLLLCSACDKRTWTSADCVVQHLQ